MSEVTELLVRWGDGDDAALDQLVPLVHQELHRIAQYHMTRERAGHSLQATALVNETYLRLVGSTPVNWRDRVHFLAVCARLMRRILVDHARGRRSQKRGGAVTGVSLDEALMIAPPPRSDLIALDDALNALAQHDERKSRVVELRYFGGLTVEETASIINVSPETVMRDWKFAKAWLQRELR